MFSSKTADKAIKEAGVILKNTADQIKKRDERVAACNARIQELQERRDVAATGVSIQAGNDEFVRASREIRDLDEDIKFYGDRIQQLKNAPVITSEVAENEIRKIHNYQQTIISEASAVFDKKMMEFAADFEAMCSTLDTLNDAIRDIAELAKIDAGSKLYMRGFDPNFSRMNQPLKPFFKRTQK